MTYEAALEVSRTLHQRPKKFTGRFLHRYITGVKYVAEAVRARTMLDYGCGKGEQYTTPLWNGQMVLDHLGVAVTKYDPAWPPFATEPGGIFDLVVATQVLAAIPLEHHGWVLRKMAGLAGGAVYIGERVSVNPSRKAGFYRGLNIPVGWSVEQWADHLRQIAGGSARVFLGITGPPVTEPRLWEVLPGDTVPIDVDPIPDLRGQR